MKLTTKENRSEREQIYVYICSLLERERGNDSLSAERERQNLGEEETFLCLTKREPS